MAWIYDAICDECQAAFRASEGSVRGAYCMKCDQCGAPHAIDHAIVDERFPEIHQRLSGAIQATLQTDGLHDGIESLNRFLPLDSADVVDNTKIETIAPPCECGGVFRIGASSRCPNCRSEKFHKDADGMEMHAS